MLACVQGRSRSAFRDKVRKTVRFSSSILFRRRVNLEDLRRQNLLTHEPQQSLRAIAAPLSSVFPLPHRTHREGQRNGRIFRQGSGLPAAFSRCGPWYVGGNRRGQKKSKEVRQELTSARKKSKLKFLNTITQIKTLMYSS